MTKIRTKSQIGRFSRTKGLSYERKVCKILSDWSGKDFKRRGVGFSDKDIITPDNFIFSIECKKVETINPSDLTTEFPEGSLKDYWVQTKEQAKKEGKSPLLIFTKNYERADYFVTSDSRLLIALEKLEDPHYTVIHNSGKRFVAGTLDDLIRCEYLLFEGTCT